MGKEDNRATGIDADELGLAIGKALAMAMPQILAATRGADSLSADSIAEAMGKVMRQQLRPTTDDKMQEIRRIPGQPRNVVPAVSQITGAKFTAILREDGTCEKITDYEFPVIVWEKGFQAHELTREGHVIPGSENRHAKKERHTRYYIPDLRAHVSPRLSDGGFLFPAHARGDAQAALAALREQIAASAKALTEASDAPAGQ